MEIKKTKKASLENKKKSIFLFGLFTSLGLFLMAFEYTAFNVEYTLPVMEIGELIEHEPAVQEIEILRPKPIKSPPKTQEPIIDEVDITDIIDDTIAKLIVVVDPVVNPDLGIDTTTIVFNEPAKVIELPPIDYAEKMPEYPGGDAAMFGDLSKNLKGNKFGISGTVYVEFIVETDGSISGVKIKRGIHESLDRKAIIAVKKLKNWEPGEQNHKAVRVRQVLPIKYIVR